MSEPLIVVGAGGFGREALDVLDRVNALEERWRVVGVADDAPSEVNLARLAARGVDYLGSATPELVTSLEVRALVVAVGNPGARAAVFERFEDRGFEFPSLVDPSALIGSNVRIATGAVICGGVSIGTNVCLGRAVHLNPNSTIGHDTTLGDFVSVNPMANVSGDCDVHQGVLIGASAVVLQGLCVGPLVTVGAGAVVVRDVTEGVTVKGVPAR